MLLFMLSVITFIIGLIIPSPFFNKNNSAIEENDLQLVEVVGMILDDGSRYDGSVIKGTKTKHGYGRLTTADKTVYEGN